MGEFGRGAMLHEFERTAFAMQAGEVSNVVKTEVGYHIIRCHEHLPPVVQPLTLMYSNVSADLAADKADSTAARLADSLHRVLRTPAQARAAAAKLKLDVIPYHRAIGEPTGSDPKAEAIIRRLESLKPGQFFPDVEREKGTGYIINWADSIATPLRPTWEEARLRAIDRYRGSAAVRALDAKRAELDSMMSQGWSFDSLATLFGGLEQAADANLGTKLPYLGARNLDTLVFGVRVPARLKLGELSGWVAFPAGQARLRVTERADPNPAQLAARLESERRLAEARVLVTYFEDLKQRFSVRILDPEMLEVMLPPVPEETPQ